MINPSAMGNALGVCVVCVLNIAVVVWLWNDQPGVDAMYVESTVVGPFAILLNTWGEFVV